MSKCTCGKEAEIGGMCWDCWEATRREDNRARQGPSKCSADFRQNLARVHTQIDKMISTRGFRR